MQKLGFILIIYGSSSESLGWFCSPCEWNHSQQVEFLPVQVPFDKSRGFHLNKSFLALFQHRFVLLKASGKLINNSGGADFNVSGVFCHWAPQTWQWNHLNPGGQSCQYTHRMCCPTLSIRRPAVTCWYKLAKFVALSAGTFHDTACLGHIFLREASFEMFQVWRRWWGEQCRASFALMEQTLNQGMWGDIHGKTCPI